MSKILKNTSAYMLAAVLPQVITFLLLPVYIRFLNPEQFGVIALVTATSGILTSVVYLQIGESLRRFYFDYGEEEIGHFFSTILYAIMGLGILFLAPVHLFWDAIRGMLPVEHPPSYYPFIFLVVFLTYINGLANYFNVMLRVQERGGLFFMISITSTVIRVSAVLYFLILEQLGAFGFLAGMALGVTFQVLAQLWAIRSSLVLAFDLAVLRKALSYSLPIIPYSLGAHLYTYSDRYILAYFLPVSAVGIYDFADRIASPLKVGIRAFDNATQPNFMRLSNLNKKLATDFYATLITRWSIGVALVYLLVLALVEDVMSLFISDEFHGAYALIPILMFAYIFKGLFGFIINGLLYEKQTKSIPVITISGGLLNVVANLFLIPVYGAIAAAWTTLISFGLIFLMAYYISRRHYPIRLEVRSLCIICGMMIGVQCVIYLAVGLPLFMHIFIEASSIATFMGVLYWLDVGELRQFVGWVWSAAFRRSAGRRHDHSS